MAARLRAVRIRLVALSAVVALAVTLWLTGAVQALSDGDRVEELLTESGPAGPIAFVLSMWLLQPLGLPGLIWMVPAGIVWPWPAAIGLSWLGNMGASSAAFAYARWIGRDWVAERIPANVRRYEERLSDGVVPVFLLRVVTGQLPPADWLLGVSSVRWRPFLVGTGLGILPGVFLLVLAGGGLVEWVVDQPREVRIGAVAVLVAAAVTRRVVLRRRSARRAVADAAPSLAGPDGSSSRTSSG